MISLETDKVSLCLIGEIACYDCACVGAVKVPAKLDSRNTVVAEDWVENLPTGWHDIGGGEWNNWDYSEQGYVCEGCWEKRAEAMMCKRIKEAEKKAKKEAKKAAKKSAKAAKKSG